MEKEKQKKFKAENLKENYKKDGIRKSNSISKFREEIQKNNSFNNDFICNCTCFIFGYDKQINSPANKPTFRFD